MVHTSGIKLAMRDLLSERHPLDIQSRSHKYLRRYRQTRLVVIELRVVMPFGVGFFSAPGRFHDEVLTLLPFTRRMRLVQAFRPTYPSGHHRLPSWSRRARVPSFGGMSERRVNKRCLVAKGGL